MKRIIVDYKKLNHDILDMLVAKYPHGYDEKDIIVFRNKDNEVLEAVEVRTEDTIYLVKVSKRLADTMESFADDNENEERGDSDGLHSGQSDDNEDFEI